MTKVKEKMMQWSRHSKKIRKIEFAIIILGLIIAIVTMLFKDPKDIVFFILTMLIIGDLIIGIYRSMIESFKDKSIEFVQKNNFWTIILSNINFILSLVNIIIIAIASILYEYCTLPGLIILVVICIFYLSVYVSKIIADFFKRRLKK